jgi:NADPH:quinone reductase-like Zn-dependent oxidoreductase
LVDAMQTAAMLIDAFGGPDRLREGEVSVPAPGPGQVRIAVRYAAVNPVDLTTRAGRTIPADHARFPMVLGWDAAGTVEAVGEGVDLEPGDRVAVLSVQVVHQRGTYAGAVLADREAVARIPAGVPDDVAAATPVAGLTALQGLGMLELGDGATLVVNGAAGAVGRFAVQLAARRGVTVVAVASAGDEALLRDLGAAHVVDRDDDVAAATRAALGGPADAGYDLVGGQAAHALLAAVRDGGRYVTAVPDRVDPTGPFEPERGISPRPVYVRMNSDQLAELLAMADDGRLTVAIAHRLPLADAARAHELVAAGGLRGKVVLET